MIPVTLSSIGEPAPGATLTYTTELGMRRRAQEMVAVFYDPATGALMSSALEVTPAPPST